MIKTLLLILSVLFFSGCAGRDIYREPLKQKSDSVLHQKWGIQLFRARDAGVRGRDTSSALIWENTLIFGNQSKGLVSLYLDLNRVRWFLPLEGGIDSKLLIDDGMVYFGGMDGFLYCVSAETGRVIWRYEVRSAKISRPTVYEGRVFVTSSDDSVYALDAKTGKWIWHYRRRPSGLPTIHGVASPLVDRSEVLVGMSDGYLVGLQLDSGQLKWEKKLHEAKRFADVDGDPVLENGILYLPTYDGSMYVIQRATLETLWKVEGGGSRSVLLDGQSVLIPGSEGKIASRQKLNSRLNWEFELDNGAPTEITRVGDYLVFGSSYQYLYVVDRLSGKLVDRFNVGWDSGFTSAVAYDETRKTLYVVSAAGNLYSFRIKGDNSVSLVRSDKKDSVKWW